MQLDGDIVTTVDPTWVTDSDRWQTHHRRVGAHLEAIRTRIDTVRRVITVGVSGTAVLLFLAVAGGTRAFISSIAIQLAVVAALAVVIWVCARLVAARDPTVDRSPGVLTNDK